MKRSIALALLVSVGILTWSAAIPSAIAHCGTCGVGDAPKKEKPCPECEKKKDGEKCSECEAKKKEDAHTHN